MMKNLIFPHISTQLYKNGYADNLSDLPGQIGNKLNMHDNSFYVDSSLYTQKNQLDGAFYDYSQDLINYQSGPSATLTIKSFDCPIVNDQLFTNTTTTPTYYYDSTKSLQLSQMDRLSEGRNQCQDSRKRSIEIAVLPQQQRTETMVVNESSDREWPAGQEMALCFQRKWQDHQVNKKIKEVKKDRVPARKSQKLSDKVTALQKLVSPYGKTDTASVLHEAFISIKFLQDQIESMFHQQSSSSDDESPHAKENGDGNQNQFNLGDKGLCLVPLSLTQKLINREAVMNHYSMMINNSELA